MPATQPANSPPASNGEHEQYQQGFKRGAGKVAAILRVGPPIGDQVTNTVRSVRYILRHICPGIVGVETRNRLKQGGGEVLPADVLDFVEEVVDAKIARVHRRFRRGKKPEVIIQFGAIASRLLGLRWRSRGGRGSEQLDLIAIGVQPRLDFAPAIGNLGANALQLVAQPIKLGVAQMRARQFTIHAIQGMLPSGRGGFEIEVEFAVQALRDLSLVDMRVSRRSLAVRRGVWRRCRLRRRLCRTGSLCVGALQGGAGTACKSQHQKDAKCPCDPLQQTHTRSPALIRPIDEATRL